MKAKKPRIKTVLSMNFREIYSSKFGEQWISTKSNILDPCVYLDMIKWDDGTETWNAYAAGIEATGGYVSPQIAIKALYKALQEAARVQSAAMQFIAKRTANTWTGQRLAGR